MNLAQQIKNTALSRPPSSENLSYRKSWLESAYRNEIPTCSSLPTIPEDDLVIITKIYFKMYPDCGRKRGALLRYIKHFRETQEPVNHSRRFFKHLQKLAKRNR